MAANARRKVSYLVVVLGVFFVPALAHPQSAAKTAKIGVLGDTPGPQWNAFRQGLGDLGWHEGQTIVIEWRWSEGRNDRLASAATELIRLGVDIIVTEGGPATIVVKKATATIPIVMTIVGDPVGTGLVASLARPGGNVTSSASPSPQLTAKQLEILREIIPGLKRLSVLVNASAAHRIALKELQTAAMA